MSFGVLLAVVVVARIAWRFAPGACDVAARGGVDAAGLEGTHYLLYALLVTKPRWASPSAGARDGR